MSNDFKIQLKQAKKLYDSKNYEDSLNLYEQLFNENPDEFELDSRISYCWAIYQVHVKQFNDIDELYDNVEFITDLIPQADLNVVNTCPYTFSVFKVLDYLYKQKEYYNVFDFIEKIDPKLLDEKTSNYNGRIYRSKKEKYYDYVSKSYLECADWELCIEVSNEALSTLKTFTNNGNIWHYWRIAKSLKELNHNHEALNCLYEVLNVKKSWFVYKEIAENYFILNEYEKAIMYIPGAVLSEDSIKMKVNLYYLIYNLLKNYNYEIALKHAKIYYLLKLENNSEISEDIEELCINKDELNKMELIKEINEYWEFFNNNKFESQSSLFKKGNSFDKSNNKSLKAIYIKEE